MGDGVEASLKEGLSLWKGRGRAQEGNVIGIDEGVSVMGGWQV